MTALVPDEISVTVGGVTLTDGDDPTTPDVTEPKQYEYNPVTGDVTIYGKDYKDKKVKRCGHKPCCK